MPRQMGLRSAVTESVGHLLLTAVPPNTADMGTVSRMWSIWATSSADRLISANALQPVYLRLSQAERERLRRQQESKAE